MQEHKTVAVIVGAGEFTTRGLPIATDDVLWIAADRGLCHLEEAGIVPYLVIGDYDSLGYAPKQQGAAQQVITLPVEKNDTDLEAALRRAQEYGCRDIRFYGASGDRPDHFLANLQLLAHISRCGLEARLVAPTYTVYALTNGSRTLHGEAGITFSVFSASGTAQGVTVSGNVKYPADEVTMAGDSTLGVSNLMTGPEACVRVKEGTLLIFQYTTPSAAT